MIGLQTKVNMRNSLVLETKPVIYTKTTFKNTVNKIEKQSLLN